MRYPMVEKILAEYVTASDFSYQDRTSQKQALSDFFQWTFECRVQNDCNDSDFDSSFIGLEVEDQLTGISGTVNGKKTIDIFKRLTTGMTENEIEEIADSMPFTMRIVDGWAYYDRLDYLEALNNCR